MNSSTPPDADASLLTRLLPVIRVNPRNLPFHRSSRGHGIAVYAGTLVIFTARSPGRPLPEPCYDPEGAEALARSPTVKCHAALPLADITSVTLRRGGGKLVEIVVQSKNDKKWRSLQLTKECLFLATALQALLGSRLQSEVDPATFSPANPAGRMSAAFWLGLVVSIAMLAAGLAIILTTIRNPLDYSSTGFQLLQLGGILTLCFLGHAMDRQALRLRLRRRLAGTTPFRHVPLSVTLKTIGVLAFVTGAYLPLDQLLARLLGAPPESGLPPLNADALLNLQMACSWLLVVLGSLAVYWGYRVGLKSATLIRAGDTRPPVLYLRSFQDDGRHDLNPRTLPAYLVGVRNILSDYFGPLGVLGNLHPLRLLQLLTNTTTDTAEEQMAWYFNRRLGPFTAIGAPGEVVATGGAARLYVPGHEWQDTVLRLLKESSAVVLQPAETEGVWWEVVRCLEHVPSHKFLICLAGYRESAQGYDAFRLRFEEITGKTLPRHRGDALFVAFDAEGRPRLLPTHTSSEWLWPIRGIGLDFETTLEPFLRRLPGLQPPPAPIPRSRFPRLRATIAATVWFLGMIVGAIFISSALSKAFARPTPVLPPGATVEAAPPSQALPPEPAPDVAGVAARAPTTLTWHWVEVSGWTEVTAGKPANFTRLRKRPAQIDELYCAAVVEPPVDMSRGLTPTDLTSAMRQMVMKQLTDFESGEDRTVEIAGIRWQEFEVIGTISNLRIHYLYRVHLAPYGIYTLSAWSLEKEFAANRDELIRVLDAFDLHP